jgi:hypothetical protein
MRFGFKNVPPTYQWVVSLGFQEYMGVFMKLFLDNFSVFNDQTLHKNKLQLCFEKCHVFGINLNPNKFMFLVYARVILGYIMSKEGKLSDLKKFFAIMNMPPPKIPKDI